MKQQLKKDIELLRKDYKNVYLTISSTSGVTNSYLSPIRLFKDCAILGVICENELFAKEIAEFMDGIVDNIFIDIEKKLAPEMLEDGRLLSNNIYHPIQNIIKQSNVYPYMPNDITVDAAWSKLMPKILEIKDAKVMIVGMGNIGVKLSLKLIETGVRVYGVTKNKDHRSSVLENALNHIKHRGAIGYVRIIDDINKAILMSDIIVFAANEANILKESYYKVLKNKVQILTIGRNNIPQNLALKLDNISTLDVGFNLLKKIESIVLINENLRKKEDENRKKVGSILGEGEEIWYDYNNSYAGGILTKKGLIRYEYEKIK